jgi:molybdate transport system substrate-binding protein
LLGLIALTGCRGATAAGGSDDEGQRQLLVFGAASLTEVFNQAARDFERDNPHVDVKVSFAGSQSLRTQIENGAQPNIFASANEKHMAALAEKGLVETPVVFAQNGLVIAVPKDNPAGIRSLADLPKAERLVLALESVPVGTYAKSMLQRASEQPEYGADFAKRVEAKVVSRENHVRQTLQKVVLGEADAAIVYATDAAAAGDQVEIIDIPAAFNVTADYPVAVLKTNDRPGLSQKFIEALQSEQGRAMLRTHGFRAP